MSQDFLITSKQLPGIPLTFSKYAPCINHTPSSSRNRTSCCCCFCFVFVFFLNRVLSSTSLEWHRTGNQAQQCNRPPGAWPLNARALLLVVTVIKRLFGRSGPRRSPWRKVQKRKIIEKKERKMNEEADGGENGWNCESGIASLSANTQQR